MKPSKWLCCLLLLALVGCSKLSLLRSQSADDDDDEVEQTTKFIGDQVTIAGLHPVQIEAVGLVTNLDNTGGDPPPTLYRTLLLNDMRKRNVKNPNALLQSPTTALVLVRAALPPVAQIGDTFDIEVVVPENSEATSLNGGWLMETYMAEQAIVPGRGPIPGHILAKARGPVLISTGEGDKASQAGVLKRGRILGGGVYLGGQQREDRKLGLYLRNEFRGVRQAKRIAETIGRRFHYYEKGLKRPLAKAMTDQHIEIRVDNRYKQNYVRYVQVIRTIALSETPVEERERVERLKKSLLVPHTASKSAMELEAIGIESIPALKEGLRSSNPEVRFYSADALAYLGDSSGADVLADAARNEEAFRVFALAALSVIDEGTTHERLRELLNEPSAETRYGAFRALWTLDKNDPFIRGELINDQFNLHVLNTSGPPMVHLTRNRTPEVTLFGAEQRLRTPIALSAGRHIVINAPAGSQTVTVSRFEADKPDEQRIVSTRAADIVRAVGELRGSYPDVAQMLTQAERQASLIGRLEIDALPQAGRLYHRQLDVTGTGSDTSIDTSKPLRTRVGRSTMVPNIFPTLRPDEQSALDRNMSEKFDNEEESEDSDSDSGSGEATLTDVTEPDDDVDTNPKKKGVLARMFSNPLKKKKPADEEPAESDSDSDAQ